MIFDIVELPKNAYKTYFSHELFAYVKKSCTFAVAKVKTTKDMLAAPVRERSDMPMVGIREVYREAQTMRPWDDVYEDLCKDLGSHYGLNDIREA